MYTSICLGSLSHGIISGRGNSMEILLTIGVLVVERLLRCSVKYRAPLANSYTNPMVSSTKKIVNIQYPYTFTSYRETASGNERASSQSNTRNRIPTR